MATKYYSDGTYTKGDGKLYYPGIGVVGRDKSTNVSKAESGSSTPINNTNKGIFIFLFLIRYLKLTINVIIHSAIVIF